nr:zinc finger protein 667-like [Procambarus clarkii]
MDTPIVASPESQDPPDPHMAETTSSPSPKPVLVRKRVKKPDRVIRLKKVCEQCGKAFNKSSKYLQHLRTHRPLLQCDKCSFKTKDTKRFRIHGITHKKANPDVRCNICSELFATEVTQRIHKKKIHNIHECKHCYTDYDSEAKLINHLKEQHGHIKEKKGYVRRSEEEYVKPINIFVDPPPANEKRQFVCRLCNKETRNKYQLKIHIAQHLGVSSSKISDDFLLTQDVDNLIKEGGLSSSSVSSQDIKLENLVPICSVEVSSLKRELDISSAGNGIHSLSSVNKTDISSISCSSMTQSASSLTPKNPLSDSLPGASVIPTIKQEPMEESSNEQDSDMDQEESSYSGGSAVFRCGLCALDFYAPTDLYQHAIKVHQIQNLSQTQPSRQVNVSKRVKPAIPCDLCNVTCKSAKALRAHHRVKHRKTFTCPACHVSHKSIIRLLRHQRQIHKDKIRCRFQCSALFDTRKESIIHCREVHNKEVRKVVCPYCEVEYQYEGNLINHLEKCKHCPPERRPVHVCGNCDEILPNIKKYNEHIKHCVLKDKKNNTVSKFKNKIINKNGVEYVEVSDNDGDGKSELSLKSNKDLEIEEEESDGIESSNYKKAPQKCKYCPDKFTKEESAINHILAVHKNLITRMITEPQMCEVCGMIFKNQLCLCKHISKHYSDLSMWDVLVPPDILDVVKVKSYCWVCKSTLRGKILHHANMRNENIDKLLATEGLELQETERFHCPKCDDFFPTRIEFWEHAKVHLSELPKWSRQLSGPSSSDNCPNKISSTYECNECSLKFTNNSEFYRHLAVHFLEPYSEDGYEIDSNNIDKDENECKQIGNANEIGDDEIEEDDFDLEGFMNPDAKYN